MYRCMPKEKVSWKITVGHCHIWASESVLIVANGRSGWRRFCYGEIAARKKYKCGTSGLSSIGWVANTTMDHEIFIPIGCRYAIRLTVIDLTASSQQLKQLWINDTSLLPQIFCACAATDCIDADFFNHSAKPLDLIESSTQTMCL